MVRGGPILLTSTLSYSARAGCIENHAGKLDTPSLSFDGDMIHMLSVVAHNGAHYSAGGLARIDNTRAEHIIITQPV